MPLTIDIRELEEPILEFGPDGEHTDPKVGLERSGPLSLRFGPGHPEHVRLGLVGPHAMLDRTRHWFERCQGYIASKSPNQALHPDFPGFSSVFRASLDLSPELWDCCIDDDRLQRILTRDPRKRFDSVLDLYTQGIRELVNRQLPPDVIITCLPAEVIAQCRTMRAPRLTPQERKLLRLEQMGQLAFPGMAELVTIQDTLLYRDFRRSLKARAMDIRVPIQIGTDNLFVDGETNEDPASRAWNVCLALFYKARGLPWRLKSLTPETCYVGISFHHLRTQKRHRVFSSLAQAFPTSGEGFALRGDATPWDRNSEERTLHLSDVQATQLVEKVLERYRESVGMEPLRMVLYKTSKFDPEEQAGFHAALAHIPVVEMVNLRPAELRLVRRGAYPPCRGTVVILNEHTYYLFTHGYFPDWETYMGAHVPVPYEVTVLGDADPTEVCTDVLRLTKLNWNTARTFTSIPIPLRFAREVGSIMSHYADLKGDDIAPESSYRYYM